MNHKALAAGVVVALIGVVLLFLYMKRYEAEASGGEPVQVLMVRRDFAVGEPMTSEGLAIRDLPERYVESRHVLAADQDRILGIRAGHGLRANQTLLWTDLATAVEGRRDLSALLRRGMRAVTVGLEQRNAIVTLLRPGDRVDVLYTGVRPNTDDTEVTINLLQNIMVLALGNNTGGPTYQDQVDGQSGVERRGISDVTVAVTVEQAALLTHAMQHGHVGIAIRNPEDVEAVEGLVDVTNERLIEPAARMSASRRRPTRETPTIEEIQ